MLKKEMRFRIYLNDEPVAVFTDITSINDNDEFITLLNSKGWPVGHIYKNILKHNLRKTNIYKSSKYDFVEIVYRLDIN